MIFNKRAQIAQPDGKRKNIERLEAGDHIMVADANLNWKKVKIVSSVKDPIYPMYPLLVNVELANGKSLTSSPDQQYLTHNSLPVKAIDINTNHKLKTVDGKYIAVRKIDRTVSTEKVYGLNLLAENNEVQLINVNGVIALENIKTLEPI